jgi:glucose-1-phosphate adenylyltransferase
MSIGFDAEDDARRFFRTDRGVVLVTREMLEKLPGTAEAGENRT